MRDFTQEEITKRGNWNMIYEPYIVDITKPPVGPPCRTMKDYVWFGMYETKESKQQTKDWYEYMEQYKKEFHR